MLAIRITDETMQVIRGAAIHDFHQTGRTSTRPAGGKPTGPG